MHDARVAALAALPAHPVFCTDLDEGIVAAALRLDARDQSDGGTAAQILMLSLLEMSQATSLGAIVGISPLAICSPRAASATIAVSATSTTPWSASRSR